MKEKAGSFFNRLQKEFVLLVDESGLKQADVKVTAKPLSPEEALGATKRKDYVLLQGKERVSIKDGSVGLPEHIAASDVIFATGSTICNDTIDELAQSGKPLVFFGTTASGAAALLSIPRFCPEPADGESHL